MITNYGRFKKREVLPIFLAVLAGTFLIFLIILNVRVRQERAKLASKIDTLEQELQEEQVKKEDFLSRISQALTPENLEKIARQELNLQKEEEKVVAFPIVAKEEKEKEEAEEKSFWQEILEMFKIRRD